MKIVSANITGSLILNGTDVSSITGSQSSIDSLNSKTGSYAVTGSNSFVGQQNINGSVAITGSLTTTGTIVAQTLNVQQVTSSVVYSSGSNVFGNNLSNTQVMTGSVSITGSLGVNGALSGTSATFTGTLIQQNITNGADLIGLNTSDGARQTNFFVTPSYSALQTTTNIPLYLGTNGNTRVTIDSSGNVGIGTTSPQTKLHVAQSASGVIFGESSSVATIIGTNAAGTASQELSLRGFPLTFTGNGGGGSEHMRITSAGNVGIGTTSPGTTLHLSATTPGLYIDDTSTNGTRNRFKLLSGDVGTTQTVLFQFDNTSDTNILTTMVVNELGNVGIGTSSPAYKLDINYTSSPATIGLKTDSLYNSIIRDYTTTTTSTLDITTERTDGGGFNFLLLISSTLVASGANRNYYTFAVQGRGTTATASQLSNVSAGTSSRTAIAISFPSNGVIRLTLTGGEECQIKVTAIGHGSL